MKEINLEIAEKVIAGFIRDSVHKNNYKNGIIGVSGGLDSAVVLALTQRALGKSHCFALLMPFRKSSPESLGHGKMICARFGVKYEVIDISPSVDQYFKRYPSKNRVLIGNKCARERMSVLYDFSIRKKALVIGTSNKSELLIGYSTLFGDSAAAFLPLGDLYKTQIFEFARYLEIPEVIIRKRPSADLWENQTDEDEIGISYRELDEILYLLVDRRMKDTEIQELGYSEERIRKIRQMIMNSQFKRTMPPIPKIQNRTIGLDFRYLRDWNK